MKQYVVGEDYQEKDRLPTYGITEFDNNRSEFGEAARHENKIEVYDDEGLRNRIIKLLNKEE